MVLTCLNKISSQSAYYIRNHQAYSFTDRYWHLTGSRLNENASVQKLYYSGFEDTLKLISPLRSPSDNFDVSFLLLENAPDSLTYNSDLGFWKNLYFNPAYLFTFQTDGFSFHVNAFANIQAGQQNQDDRFIFLNKRGLELWGQLDKKFYFYTSLHENQSNFFNYIDNFIEENNTIPREGHYKPFESSLSTALTGYDYANATAYLGYNTSRHTTLEFGHGRHFIGNGIRSLLLSDYAHNYLYLNFSVNVWKLHYQSMVAELSPISSQQTIGNTVLPKKYMATHYLSFDISPRLEIGLFESVVFSRENQFEFHYLNPVILFRTVEALIDSPDNVLLGLNANWLIAPRTSVYFQLLIDELRTSEIFSDNKWWGNKWAYQAGIKHFDFLNINNLDLQLEFNKVRPYTYSHNSTLASFNQIGLSSYSHFNQALAHPLGSNFSEYILRIKYRPIPRLTGEVQFLFARKGKNTEDQNLGGNILLNNTSRVSDFGNNHLQGELSEIKALDLQLSYMFVHDLSLDLLVKIRSDESASLLVETNYLGVGFRYNFSNSTIDY